MINSLCDAILQLLIVIPLVVAARKSKENFKTEWLIAAALVFVLTSVATDLLSQITIFTGQQWNWTGKVASLLIALIFILLFKPLTSKEFGLTTKMNWTNANPILLICTAYFFLRFLIYYTATKQITPFHTETILFQATLPGLEEEIVFRGILLTLLNRVFARPKWTLAKVPFGWAAILTSVLFGLTHGIFFDNNFHLQFNAFIILRIAFDGFLFALLVEKTKSLISSIWFHNLINLIGNH